MKDAEPTVTPEAAPRPPGFRMGGERPMLSLREMYDIVLSGKWVILGSVAIGLAIGLFVSFIAVPIYQTNGLIQVETSSSGLEASLNKLTSVTDSPRPETSGEVVKLKSRMILGAVAKTLNMDVWCQPWYFPYVGEAFARRAELGKPAPARFGLTKYAWGGEIIRVTAFDVPPSMINAMFFLVATDSGYDLKYNGTTVLSGHAGDRANGTVAQGPVSIYVQELVARPGTTFFVAHRSIVSVIPTLASGLSVGEQPRDSGIITLEFESSDPTMATAAIDEVENVFLQQNVERRSAQAEQSLKFLEQQLPLLKENVTIAESKLNQYQLKMGSVDIAKETELALTQAVSLETDRQKLLQQRDSALRLYTKDHPIVQELEGQISQIEKSQATEHKQVEKLPETQQEILSLMRDLQVNTELYTTLLNSAQELQIAKAGTVGSVSIIDRAAFPAGPVKPNKSQIVMVAIFLGALVGVAGLIGMRLFIRGVDRPEELERALGLMTYATIPYSTAQRRLGGRMRDTGGTANLLSVVEPNDPSIEALRGLRTALHFAMMDARNNIVVFTGPIAALGKSFVSINLGAVIAMSGTRVIVIDGDMRRGRLNKYVGGNAKPGLSDYVGNHSTPEEVIQSGGIENLDFISAGTRPPNPSEILLSPRFAELLEYLSSKYEFVLIDTPPVLPVTDAAVIGRLAGTTMVVLKAGEHPMSAIEETIRRLAQSGVPVRGVVFNQVGARIGSYGYGSYGYSYGYSAYGPKPN